MPHIVAQYMIAVNTVPALIGVTGCVNAEGNRICSRMVKKLLRDFLNHPQVLFKFLLNIKNFRSQVAKLFIRHSRVFSLLPTRVKDFHGFITL